MWHAAWDADFVFWGGYDLANAVDLPSVKHLLADLCNAVNERWRLRFDAEISWMIADRTTTTTPVYDDFVGTLLDIDDLTPSMATLPELCETLRDKVEELFAAGTHRAGWYTDSTFATVLTYAAAVSNVGLMSEADLEAVNGGGTLLNWGQRDWWDTLRGVVEQARYLESRVGISVGAATADWYGFPPGSNYPDGTRQELWDYDAGNVNGSSTVRSYLGCRALGSYTYTNSSSWSHDDGALNTYAVFEKCRDRSVEWDSDYNETLSAARDYPPPKTAHNGKLMAQLSANFEVIWTPGGGLRESGEPAIEDLSLDLTVLGAAATIYGDNTISSPVNPLWVEIEEDPDGTDAVECDLDGTAPPIIPDGGYEPDDYDPGAGSSIVDFEADMLVTLQRINAQFDLNSVFDYPAA